MIETPNRELNKARVRHTLTPEQALDYKEHHGSVWELYNPPPWRCGLCGCKVVEKERIYEIRRTGLNGKKQTWTWCPPCAIAYKDKPIMVYGLQRVMRQYMDVSEAPNQLGKGPKSVAEIHTAFTLR